MSDADRDPRRGRPREVLAGTPATVWLPGAEYDHLTRVAQAQRMTVSGLLRVWVHRQLGEFPIKK